jgi:hypothetical protein
LSRPRNESNGSEVPDHEAHARDSYSDADHDDFANNFWYNHTTVSSNEDGIPETKTMGTGDPITATQMMMMMITLITGIKEQDKRMRDNVKKI